MALENYRLRPPSVVIAADNRDPYVSWQNHLARTGGARGGVDIVAVVGTPIYARTAGRMIQIPNDGSAGNSCRFYHRDNTGWKDVFSHLSSYRTPKNPQGLNGFDYEAGDIVAISGNSGNVTQHLHWHLLDPNGNRQNPWNYFSGSATAGDNITPITEPDPIIPEDKDIPMEMYLKAPNDVIFHVMPGVKANFRNVQEYNNWRSVMETYVRVTPGAKNVVPPPVDQVMGISWAAYEQVKLMYGIAGE